MKKRSVKTISTIVMVFFLCAAASAQQRSLLEELKGLETFRSERLRDLKFFVSTEDDIVRLMGKRCLSICDYDASWNVYFSRVGNWGMGKDGRHYRPKAQFMRKLAGIKFFAKRPFMITSPDDLPAGVECRSSSGLHEAPAIKNRVCTDAGKRISFYIPSETTADGRYVEGQLLWINFGSDPADYDNIWELIPK